VNLPIALWLCGAARVITVDLNPYLTAELVFQSLAFVRENRAQVVELFGHHAARPQFQQRLALLLDAQQHDLTRLLRESRIEYLAPADAARLPLPDHSIDYHVSFTVLEHIPPALLRDILAEGRRLLRPTGRFVHCVDFSDHFAHSDSSLSPINFLSYSEAEWARYAGNRYMYHNRLRVDELADLLASSELEINLLDARINPRALEDLQHGFPLAERFQHKTPEINATGSAWIVAAPSVSGAAHLG
jgi:SAM-dependent methyltransferase